MDAILYGEIPWYGRTRLIYPILGESLDIATESVALGLVNDWNQWQSSPTLASNFWPALLSDLVGTIFLDGPSDE